MRALAVGFAAYVAGVIALSALAVYLLLPVAAGLRASDAPAAPPAIAAVTAPLPAEPSTVEAQPPAATDEPPASPTPASPTIIAVTEPSAPIEDTPEPVVATTSEDAP